MQKATNHPISVKNERKIDSISWTAWRLRFFFSVNEGRRLHSGLVRRRRRAWARCICSPPGAAGLTLARTSFNGYLSAHAPKPERIDHIDRIAAYIGIDLPRVITSSCD